MDSNERNKVIAFDTLFSSNHIQMLKIILPCLDNQMQKTLAVYIKFLELQYTIDFYNKHPYPLCGCMTKESSSDLNSICSELLPYCTEPEKKQIMQLRSMWQNMEMVQEMTQTMDLMQSIMPDMSASTDDPCNPNGNSHASQNDFNIMELLMNMLTPEQKQMYELFGGMKSE